MNLSYRGSSFIMVVIFTSSMVIGPYQRPAQAQPIPDIYLPPTGTSISLTPAFQPVLLKGLSIDLQNPLALDFIVEKGDAHSDSDEDFRNEVTRMIKYFLATLTVPEDELWVNLFPFEEKRVIPESLGETVLGRDLLAQDYILKQLSAFLISPDHEVGHAFWQQVYAKARKLYGTIEIPVNVFRKVWIVPDRVKVYVQGSRAFVVNSRLKVMMEEEYLSDKSMPALTTNNSSPDQLSMTTQIIKQVLLPEIEQEVNQGKHFARLRQMYHAMILATWLKRNLQETLLGKIYVNQNKTQGVDVRDKEVTFKIYQEYLRAFHQGAVNFIKEEFDEATQTMIPRKYFSGGASLSIRHLTEETRLAELTPRERSHLPGDVAMLVSTKLYEASERNERITRKVEQQTSSGRVPLPEDKAIKSEDTELYPLISDIHSIHTLSTLGVIFLLFSIGLEFSFTKLAKLGTVAFVASTIEIFFI